MFPEFLSVAPEWLVAIAIAILVFNWVGRMLSEASETWAKALGPLGRRWRNRGVARQEARHAERLGRMADLDDMTRQRDALDHALDRCRKSQESTHEYLAYDVDWHRNTSLSAIEAGCKLPEHKSYLRWREDRNAGK